MVRILVVGGCLVAAGAVVLLRGDTTWHRLAEGPDELLVRAAETAATSAEAPLETTAFAEYLTRSGAFKALRDFGAQRAYPGSSFPKSGYREAFDHTRKQLAEAGARSGGAEPWTALGPHNIGGRMLCLAFNPQNPNTIYAGSASGGLWRTYTAGIRADAWHQVATGFPVLGIGSIAIDRHDSNTIYIGTGEVYSYDDTEGGIAVRLTRGSFGLGILKTVDGGQSWSPSLDWSYQQQRGVWVVRIDPLDRDVVWAGTTEGTYKSVDAGLSWRQVDATIMVNDLVIHPTDPDIVLIACGNLGSEGRGLYRTADGGASWQRCESHDGLPSSFYGKAMLAISESDPDVVMASIGNGTVVGGLDNRTWLCRSTDSGLTWEIVSREDYSRWQGWFAHDVAIHPDDPARVIAAGIDIYRSHDAGADLVRASSWSGPGSLGRPPLGGQPVSSEYSHADHHDIVYHPVNHDTIYFANDGGIFRSVDAGHSFQACNGQLQTTQFYAGFSSSTRDSRLALGGLQDNATAVYTGTAAWTMVVGGDGGWTGLGWGHDEEIFASVYYLGLYRIEFTGPETMSWQACTPVPIGADPVSFIAPFALGWQNATTRIIYAGSSRIFRSDDSGSSWYPSGGGHLDGNPALAIVVSPLDYRTVYVTTAPVRTRAGVFRSRDGGASWDNVTADLPDRYPVGLAVDPTDDDTAYITFSGFGTSHLYRTRDGGESWQDIGVSLPDVPTLSVVVDPLYPQQIYVGNDLGVYVSQNRGESWNAFTDGLPDAVIAMDLTISPINRMLRVSTYGNGVFERPLLDDTELPDSEDLPSADNPVVLRQNHPNPFNDGTAIRFGLAVGGQARLSILDGAGRRIRTLVDGYRDAGWHDESWDGRDSAGYPVASGVYIYRLRTDLAGVSRMLTVLR